MKKIASVDMLVENKEQIAVKITASDDFMDLDPLNRVSFLFAASQLCCAGITAIKMDHPECEKHIDTLLEGLTIGLPKQAIN